MIHIILKMEIRDEDKKFKISKSSKETKEDFYFESRNVI